MSDDGYGVNREENNGRGGGWSSLTRYSNVTDNLDTVFDLLSDARRRYLLYYLFSVKGNVVEFEAAVNAVYKYETAGTDTDNYAPRENIKIDLHHCQLPQLAEAGVLDYDPRQRTIRITRSPAVEEWVEHARYRETES